MAQESTSPTRVVEDARRLLRTVRAEVERGRRPYTSDVRRLIERGLALRFADYVQFLEKYGFLSLDRRTDTLGLTAAGEQVVDGHDARLRSMAGDAKYHFGDRLNAAPLAKDPGVEAVRVDERYLRYERIGRGGLGTVWRGHHLTLDRPVALKTFEGLEEVFRPDQQDEIRRRMELAVRAHARLINPFIIQIIDQNAHHSPPYFVMELAEGGNLRALLEAGKLAPSVAVRYFVQVALGLKTAHAQGLLHRDLKPEAVLLDATGNVKLSDFGVTRIAERDGAHMRQAYVGYGSVGYMAPELFRGVAAGPAADIYALGILLYEMLTGELPGRRSPMPSKLVEGVPADLDELFDRMTQDDPTLRPGDLDQVLTAVWTSRDVVALLDARQAPFFVEPPMALPGLPGPRRDPLEALLAEAEEPGAVEQVAVAPVATAPAASAPAASAPVATAPAASAPVATAPAAATPVVVAPVVAAPAAAPQQAAASITVFQAPVTSTAPAAVAPVQAAPAARISVDVALEADEPSRGPSGVHPVIAPAPRGRATAPVARRPVAANRITGDHPALDAEPAVPEVVAVVRDEPRTDVPHAVPVAIDDEPTGGIFASQGMDRFDGSEGGSIEELDLEDVLEDGEGRARGMTREEISNRLKKLRKS